MQFCVPQARLHCTCPSPASSARQPAGVSSEPHLHWDRPSVTAPLFTVCLHPGRPSAWPSTVLTCRAEPGTGRVLSKHLPEE